jgi:bifunctional non-homologous end joining protein LigD
MAQKQELKVGARTLAVSNLDKVLFPGDGFTKGQVIDYYIRISKYLLPHLRNRPVTMKRYPDGVNGKFFYEKDAPRYTPDWVPRFPVPRREGGPDIQYILINNLPALVWCANLANLELHPFLHRAPHIERPGTVVFDLDPGDGVNILGCVEVAFLLKDLLARLGLESFAKTSGSKGMQVYAPLNMAVDYARTQPFARAVAEYLAREHPKRIVAEMAKSARPGKVFIDWSQNSDFKTTAGVYSLRAKRPYPLVSMPAAWDELARARRAGDAEALEWRPAAALQRVEELGDLFAPVLKLKQKLPKNFAAEVGG